MEVKWVGNITYMKNTNKKKFIKSLMLANMNTDEDFKLGDTVVLPIKDMMPEYYVVKPNEDIKSVSQKFNVDVEMLAKLNKCNNFFAGQKVRLR